MRQAKSYEYMCISSESLKIPVHGSNVLRKCGRRFAAAFLGEKAVPSNRLASKSGQCKEYAGERSFDV